MSNFVYQQEHISYKSEASTWCSSNNVTPDNKRSAFVAKFGFDDEIIIDFEFSTNSKKIA